MHQASAQYNPSGAFFGQDFIGDVRITGKMAGESGIVNTEVVSSPGRFIHKSHNDRAVIQFPCCMNPDITFCPGVTVFLMQDLERSFIALPILTFTLETLHVIVRDTEVIQGEPHDPV
jgi:hypothetical protein